MSPAGATNRGAARSIPTGWCSGASWSCYSEEEIAQWAARIVAWRDGGEPVSPRRISSEPAPKAKARDVFCYFDNTDKLHAPANAARLLGMLGLPHGMGEDGRFRPLPD